MRLYLVRHGETVANAQGRVQGQREFGLSPLGCRQALATARALQRAAPDALFSSPLTRARETAEILSRQLGLSIRYEDRLKELRAGVFEGLLWSECEERYPEATASWRSGDPDFAIPEGESRRQLADRGRQALEGVRRHPCERAVVVAHGGILTAALKALLQVPVASNPFGLANCSVSEFTWESEVQLVRLNDTGHLRGLGPDGAGSGCGEL